MEYRYRETIRGSVDVADILTAYTKAFHISQWRLILSTIAMALGVGGIFRLADASYREMTDEDEQRFFEFLKKDKTDLEKYIAEDFDCDDFEFRLHGEVHKDPAFAAMPIFITWVSWNTEQGRVGHAVKSYYKDGIVKIVEPQNDRIFDVPESWQLDMLCG